MLAKYKMFKLCIQIHTLLPGWKSPWYSKSYAKCKHGLHAYMGERKSIKCTAKPLLGKSLPPIKHGLNLTLAAEQRKLLTRKICLAEFLWLPTTLNKYLHMVVCFILLSQNICLAEWCAYWALFFYVLARHVHEAGGICVVDEVQVGFGRVGNHWWAFQTQGPGKAKPHFIPSPALKSELHNLIFPFFSFHFYIYFTFVLLFSLSVLFYFTEWLIAFQ